MAGLKKLLKQTDEDGDYDLHDVLRRRKKVERCPWHLNIDQNHNAIEITEKFHRAIRKKLKPSSSVTSEIDTIEKTFLELLPPGYEDWDRIKKCFNEARAKNSPKPIIRAYTLAQKFTTRLQFHSAVNTHHALKLYCTLLNCPILAQTQEYTEAFTRILFHPELDEYRVRNGTFYRGIVLKDKKFIANYAEGGTIITTTFLSTSANRSVAEMYATASGRDINEISVLCTYNINNMNRHTAIDVGKMSNFEDEAEIIILRYVPFKIGSVERKEDDRRIEIRCDECPE